MAACAGVPEVGRLILVKITFIYLVLKKYFGGVAGGAFFLQGEEEWRNEGDAGNRGARAKFYGIRTIRKNYFMICYTD
jgi:hypothetical protein